jgi:hypothetical protein
LANLSQFFSILSDLKCYKNVFSSFTNHLITLKAITFKDFLSGLEIGYELFDPIFFTKTNPLTSRGRNSFAFSLFSPIFIVKNVPIGGFYLLFKCHKKWGPLAKMVSKPYLKCFDTILPTIPWISISTSPILKSML